MHQHEKFVNDWCLENEMLVEDLDDGPVLEAQVKFQRMVRMIPGKDDYRVKSSVNFGRWPWRYFVIKRYIGQEDRFKLFLIYMLHTRYNFMVPSYLQADKAWDNLDSDILKNCDKMYEGLSNNVKTHLGGMIRGDATIFDFPSGTDYLDCYLSSLFYHDCCNYEGSAMHAVIQDDKEQVIKNYRALYSKIYLLNRFCTERVEGEIKDEFIKLIARATDQLLCEQPGVD